MQFPGFPEICICTTLCVAVANATNTAERHVNVSVEQHSPVLVFFFLGGEYVLSK